MANDSIPRLIGAICFLALLPGLVYSKRSKHYLPPDVPPIPYEYRKLPSCGPVIEKHVTIIGAGWAGMAAAYKLNLTGELSFRIIEATDKTGGRIQTRNDLFYYDEDETMPIPIDIGAEEFNGRFRNEKQFNPILGLTQTYGLEETNLEYLEMAGFRKDGKRLKDKKVTKAIKKFDRNTEKCLDAAGDKLYNRFIKNKPPLPDRSSEEVLREDCNYEADTNLKKLARYFRETWEFVDLPGPGAVGTGNFPEDSYFDFSKDDRPISRVTSGFGNLVQQFAELYEIANFVDFNTKAVKVWYSYTDPDTDKERAFVLAIKKRPGKYDCTQWYESDFVMTTQTNSALEHLNETMYEPFLDTSKSTLKTVPIEKLYFQWDSSFTWEPFTMSNPKQYIGIAFGDDIDKVPVCSIFLNLNRENLFPGSRMLQCWLVETQLKQIKLADVTAENAHENVLSALKFVVEKDGATWVDPVKFEHSDWQNNEFSKGSWEVWKFGGTYEDYYEFFEPRERLHICGTASCPRYWGFGWGALLNGIYCADYMTNRSNSDDIEDLVSSDPGVTSPCLDQNRIKKTEWERFYNENPFLDFPLTLPL